MPFDKAGLKANLITFFTAMRSTPMTIEDQADQMATLIDTYAKTGHAVGVVSTPNVQSGGSTVNSSPTNLPLV